MIYPTSTFLSSSSCHYVNFLLQRPHIPQLGRRFSRRKSCIIQMVGGIRVNLQLRPGRRGVIRIVLLLRLWHQDVFSISNCQVCLRSTSLERRNQPITSGLCEVRGDCLRSLGQEEWTLLHCGKCPIESLLLLGFALQEQLILCSLCHISYETNSILPRLLEFVLVETKDVSLSIIVTLAEVRTAQHALKSLPVLGRLLYHLFDGRSLEVGFGCSEDAHLSGQASNERVYVHPELLQRSLVLLKYCNEDTRELLLEEKHLEIRKRGWMNRAVVHDQQDPRRCSGRGKSSSIGRRLSGYHSCWYLYWCALGRLDRCWFPGDVGHVRRSVARVSCARARIPAVHRASWLLLCRKI